ncbi:MAG: aminopeptidase [Anaerolineae bacterium]|nr:MAG: aminopeptidase [Anaerolineae bacterium]
MSLEFQRNLDKYAEVTVRVGLNLQPGQRLLIGMPLFGIYGTPLELAPLVRTIVAKAYQAGARLVDVMWNDDQLRLIRFQHAPRDSFEEFPTWRADAAFEAAKAGDAVLVIYAENPDLLVGQDPELVAVVQHTNFKHSEPTMDLVVKNAMNWALITAPVEGWPQKVFPDLPPDSRKAKFWDTIFEICRVKQADPVSAWQDHVNELVVRSDYLNRKRYAALKLTAPGTDLTVGLPSGHIWRGARMTSQNGIDFTANIPTEEIFTIPHKDRTEGVVTATKPLSYGGILIQDLSLTFSEGRVVKATAKKGEQSLHKLLETDEGASRLGEVALVPHSSPISQSGLLFYNILIDENASNHIALGRAYKFSLENGEAMSDDEFAAIGGNHSLIHIDCMIGSGEMDVDGLLKDGTAEPIMRGGEWAFEV